MAVVINEFEVVPDTRPASGRAGGEQSGEAPAAKPLDPRAVAQALRALEARALRVWAH